MHYNAQCLLVQEADADGNYDDTLSFEEFCSLFKELSERREITNLFSLYSSKKEWLTVHDLQGFLKCEQGDDVFSSHSALRC